MENLQRLISKAHHKGYRLLMRFDDQERGEEWCIKLYPDPEDDAHFYAYHTSIDAAAYQLLGEVEEHGRW